MSARPIAKWILCGAAALALHAGGIALAFSGAEVPESDERGARAMEVSLDFTAPKVEETDLPPGPPAEAAAAAPDAVAQEAKADASDDPVEKPDDTETPDRTISPKAAKEPTENKPLEEQRVTSSAAIAAEASAPAPSPAARTAERSAAPTLGTGETARKIVQSWQRQLVAHLDRHKRYPVGVPRHKADIVVSFVLNRTGHVVSAVVSKSSGDPAFDDAALAMLRRADPVPAPPPVLADVGLSFTLPVAFRAESRKN